MNFNFKKMSFRIAFVVILFVVVCFVYLVRMINISANADPSDDIQVGTYERREPIQALRGEIYDRNGKLLICSLRLTETDPAACWLKNRILAYGTGESFRPVQSLTDEQFLSLCKASPVVSEKNSNEARNRNDITA